MLPEMGVNSRPQGNRAGARIETHVADLVERVQRSETELLRNEQLAAVGQLAASIAHEFRNPLMPMKMLVQAALERNDGRGLCGRQLEVVEEEIERLERSIQVFLEFARPVSPEKSEFDVVPIVEQSLELVEARARKQAVGLRWRFPDLPVTIVADVGQIRQVLLNLLLNALDAMPEGGDAAVDVRRLSVDDVPEPDAGRALVRSSHFRLGKRPFRRCFVENFRTVRDDERNRHGPGAVDLPTDHRSSRRRNCGPQFCAAAARPGIQISPSLACRSPR